MDHSAPTAAPAPNHSRFTGQSSFRAVSERFFDQCSIWKSNNNWANRLWSSFRAVSEQFQSDSGSLFHIKLTLEQFQSSFRAVLDVFHWNSTIGAVSEQFQSDSWSLFHIKLTLEQFQSSYRAVSEQFQMYFTGISLSGQFQSSFRAVSERFQITSEPSIQQSEPRAVLEQLWMYQYNLHAISDIFPVAVVTSSSCRCLIKAE